MVKRIKKRIRSLDYFELSIIEFCLIHFDTHYFDSKSDFDRFQNLRDYISQFRLNFRDFITKNLYCFE